MAMRCSHTGLAEWYMMRAPDIMAHDHDTAFELHLCQIKPLFSLPLSSLFMASPPVKIARFPETPFMLCCLKYPCISPLLSHPQLFLEPLSHFQLPVAIVLDAYCKWATEAQRVRRLQLSRRDRCTGQVWCLEEWSLQWTQQPGNQLTNASMNDREVHTPTTAKITVAMSSESFWPSKS